MKAPRPTHADRVARAALVCVFALIAAATWAKWGYLAIDCGREMYVPAELSIGRRLYSDLWYIYGPLVPYWHGLLFRLFGIHLEILFAAGLCVAAGTAATLYSLSRWFLSPWLSFTVTFAFILQAFQLNLFNYILPYAYPAAYGSFATVLLAWLLIRDCRTSSSWNLFAAGVLAGLMALTKVEFGLAAYVSLAAAIILRYARTRSFSSLVRDAALVLPGLLLCVSVYWWFVETRGWNRLFGENMGLLPDSHYARFASNWLRQQGLTISPYTLARSFAIGVFGTVVVAALTVWAARSRRARFGLLGVGLAICAVHFAASFVRSGLHREVPLILFRVAPVLFFNQGMLWLSLVLMIVAVLRWRKHPESERERATILLALAAFIAGIRSLTKIEPMSYSIYFDTLAYLVWIVVIVRLVGRFRSKVPEMVWKGFAIVFCCGVVALTAANYPIHLRKHVVQTPRGTVYTSRVFGEAFSETLAFLQEARARGETFVAMPEDTALYYFAEVSSATRWYVMVPLILAPGAPVQEIKRDIDRAAVKYIVLSNRATPEYGAPVFGIDYHQDLYRWVLENFRPVKKVGKYEQVSSPTEWGAMIYERKPK